MPRIVPPVVEARHGGVPSLHTSVVRLGVTLGQELSGERDPLWRRDNEAPEVAVSIPAESQGQPEPRVLVVFVNAPIGTGAVIAGASVQVSEAGWTSGTVRTRVQTNNQGDYSLSFIETGFCPEALFTISASAQGFQSVALWGLLVEPDATHLRCTDEPQTINFQLERGHGWSRPQ